MKRRSEEWYIGQANIAAQNATDPNESAKHAKIALDIRLARLDHPHRPVSASREFLDLAYGDKDEWPQNAQMASRAINYVTYTSIAYPRVVYVGRHAGADPAFMLLHLPDRPGHTPLRISTVSAADHTSRAIAIAANQRDARWLAGSNDRTLIRAGALPLVQGRFESQLGRTGLFTQDDETPTHIISGRKALARWIRTVNQDDGEVGVEYASKVHHALKYWNIL